MKYLMLIHQGDAPTPYEEAWGRLSEDERNQIAADYQAPNQTDGVTPGIAMQHPETATTVRVEDGRTLTERALERVHSDAERRFLEGRLAELPPS